MLIALAALAAVTTSAVAADMPTKAPQYVNPAALPDWSGFVVGIQGGYGWASATPDVPITPFSNPSTKGWAFGGYGGYNWQVGQYVLGLEVAYTQADLTESQTVNRTSVNTKLDRLGNVNAKMGYLITPGMELYAAGGLAFGGAEATLTNGVNSVTARGNHWGWDAGVGAEIRLAQHLSLGLEYLHYGLGNATYSVTGIGAINARVTADVVKAKLGWQF
jgi:outer membrane immunogenic protein